MVYQAARAGVLEKMELVEQAIHQAHLHPKEVMGGMAALTGLVVVVGRLL
jgi:ABC-type transporter Mla maintaining outer membrane lipid asymmetry ATPase subunit MlaF